MLLKAQIVSWPIRMQAMQAMADGKSTSLEPLLTCIRCHLAVWPLQKARANARSSIGCHDRAAGSKRWDETQISLPPAIKAMVLCHVAEKAAAKAHKTGNEVDLNTAELRL